MDEELFALEEVETMEGDKSATSIRLQMPPELYQRVRHAAVDEYTNASAWIRDAITRKLDAVPDDPALASVCGAWAAMTDEGRDLVARLVEALATAPGYRRPPEE